MPKTIKVKLSQSSIRDAIRELEDYRDSLEVKTEEFVERLLEVGIECAQNVPGIGGSTGSHGFENRVSYYKEIEPGIDGCHGIMVGTGETIEEKWYTFNGEERFGSINTMLALEFGTAATAEGGERFGFSGGSGTNSVTGGYFADSTLWYFVDDYQEILDEETGKTVIKRSWKKATSITPTRPMTQASQEMISQIKTIAKEVFGK